MTTSDRASGSSALPFWPVRVGVGDNRYPSLATGFNLRFPGTPDTIYLAESAEHVREAVGEAVGAGKRVAVRSGGHCLEDFTAGPDVKALIDLSLLSSVYYDAERGAFAVEPGATLGQVYSTLLRGWGVTIPAGTCPVVGAGGHILAGGYGLLSRRYGLVSDHLYGVEAVTVDESGKARIVRATREPDDPDRDLWWAHTGGGGGNFGVVTRYWLRSPGVSGDEPSRVLPKAPGDWRRRIVAWPWDSMDESAFTRLVRNFCDWFEQNSAPDSPGAQIWGALVATHRSAGALTLFTGCCDDVVDGDALMADYVEKISSGVGVAPIFEAAEAHPYLHDTNWVFEFQGRFKDKAADLRKGLSDAQIAVTYRYLTLSGYTNPSAVLTLSAYGGKVNAVAPDATATAARDSILRAYFTAGKWTAPADDAQNIAWVREFYRDVFADTGGVPVPGPISSGCYINYPDIDLADPAWNTSGVPWETIYYQGNYPRLQQIKRRYDPLNIFRHALSITPA